MRNNKTKRPAPVKPEPWYKTIPSIAWVVLFVSLIAVVSIRRNYEINMPAATPAPADSLITWKKITNPNIMFFSKIFLQRNKTYISIPLKYETGFQTTWLILNSSSSATPAQWLITHPVLKDLSWSSINDGTIFLYQKQKQYNSLSDLLKNPPPSNKIIIDESVTKIDKFKNFQGTQLTEKFNLDEFDYVLTTYKKSEQKGDELYYSNIVDATAGELNKNENLFWQLNIPSVSEAAPISIGEIHVDYR